MGCCVCKSCKEGGKYWRHYQKFVVGINVGKDVDPSFYEPYLDAFAYVGLTKAHVIRLLNVFFQVDTDKGGTISTLEMLMFLDVERTEFSEAVFGIFDYDRSDEIDFKEYVLAMWNYCSMSDAEMPCFAFHIFAKDYGRDGKLMKLEQCDFYLDTIFGKDGKRGNTLVAKKVTSDALRLACGGLYDYGVDEKKFADFTKKHHLAIAPCVELQRRLRSKVCGASFWRARTKWRRRNFRGKTWAEIEAGLNKFLMSLMEKKKAAAPKVQIRTTLRSSEKEKKEKKVKKVKLRELTPEEEEELAAKKKGFRTIMVHGYEQVVRADVADDMVKRGDLEAEPPQAKAATSDFKDDRHPEPDPPGANLKIKPIRVKRSRNESIEAIRELHRLKHHRGAKGRNGAPPRDPTGGVRPSSRGSFRTPGALESRGLRVEPRPQTAYPTMQVSGRLAGSPARRPSTADGARDDEPLVRPKTAPAPVNRGNIPGLEHFADAGRVAQIKRFTGASARLHATTLEPEAPTLSREEEWMNRPTVLEAAEIFDDGYGYRLPSRGGTGSYKLGGMTLIYDFTPDEPPPAALPPPAEPAKPPTVKEMQQAIRDYMEIAADDETPLAELIDGACARLEIDATELEGRTLKEKTRLCFQRIRGGDDDDAAGGGGAAADEAAPLLGDGAAGANAADVLVIEHGPSDDEPSLEPETSAEASAEAPAEEPAEALAIAPAAAPAKPKRGFSFGRSSSRGASPSSTALTVLDATDDDAAAAAPESEAEPAAPEDGAAAEAGKPPRRGGFFSSSSSKKNKKKQVYLKTEPEVMSFAAEPPPAF